jgi:hypothetical protein
MRAHHGGSRPTRALVAALIGVALLVAPSTAASQGVTGPAAPFQWVAGAAPIVVFTNPGDPFSRYYAEILQAEGLNEFDLVDVADLSAASLADRAVVLLPASALTDQQVTALTAWVQAGGSLIALRPDQKLAGLLGLGAVTGTLADAYYKVDATRPPGQGLTTDTMQFHGTADRWTLDGATPVATLYANATDATTDPAVTLRDVGSLGGQAAAFSFDLARSVVYTRQGNPLWSGQERDFGQDAVTRSDDLFFGAKPGDLQPDWVDFNKIRIPQADELQRLLANLITETSTDRLPLPRFWYLPRGLKAAVIMTGDDHAVGGTSGQFDRLVAASPVGCSVAEWTCLRSTSYMVPNTPLTDAQVAAYQAEGFELALHLDTGCENFTPASLQAAWATQLPQAAAAWPSMAPVRTNRTHCVVWSDWASEPKQELANGVRLDTNYYYWPGSWVKDRPGMFTGSGFPMRFADLDGTTIDVYQATTQLTDESGIDIRTHIHALLDGALGPDGYYGVFTANMHTDLSNNPGANDIVAEAQARGVPVIAARQMLDWLDGRNGSSFGAISFSGQQLHFTVTRAATGAQGLQGMLPTSGPSGALKSLARAGSDVPTTARALKGIDYAVFDAAPGDYVATYGDPVPDAPPTLSPEPSASPSGTTLTAIPSAATRSAPGIVPTVTPVPLAHGTLPPAIAIGPKRIRVAANGTLKLQATCLGCLRGVGVRLQWRARDIASGRLTFKKGKASVTLKLTSSARRRLAKTRSLHVVAIATRRGAQPTRQNVTLTKAPQRR